MKPGFFITFEGIDGAGKSSHVGAIAEALRGAGKVVTATREPGGTPLAEKIRTLVLNDPMDPMTEALLVFAARRDHIQNVIRPALARGEVVLCDRFTDSSFAYQGYGRAFSQDVLTTLEGWVQGEHLSRAFASYILEPDLTLLYDIDPAIAAQRLAGARTPDRFESEQSLFFTRVRQGYLNRLASDPARFIRLDAAQSKEKVWEDLIGPILNALEILATLDSRSHDQCGLLGRRRGDGAARSDRVLHE